MGLKFLDYDKGAEALVYPRAVVVGTNVTKHPPAKNMPAFGTTDVHAFIGIGSIRKGNRT